MSDLYFSCQFSVWRKEGEWACDPWKPIRVTWQHWELWALWTSPAPFGVRVPVHYLAAAMSTVPECMCIFFLFLSSLIIRVSFHGALLPAAHYTASISLFYFYHFSNPPP